MKRRVTVARWRKDDLDFEGLRQALMGKALLDCPSVDKALEELGWAGGFVQVLVDESEAVAFKEQVDALGAIGSVTRPVLPVEWCVGDVWRGPRQGRRELVGFDHEVHSYLCDDEAPLPWAACCVFVAHGEARKTWAVPVLRFYKWCRAAALETRGAGEPYPWPTDAWLAGQGVRELDELVADDALLQQGVDRDWRARRAERATRESP